MAHVRKTLRLVSTALMFAAAVMLVACQDEKKPPPATEATSTTTGEQAVVPKVQTAAGLQAEVERLVLAGELEQATQLVQSVGIERLAHHAWTGRDNEAVSYWSVMEDGVSLPGLDDWTVEDERNVWGFPDTSDAQSPGAGVQWQDAATDAARRFNQAIVRAAESEALLHRLNEWNVDELMHYEDPSLDPGFITDGETNAFVAMSKDELIELGYRAIWDAELKQYQLRLQGDTDSP